MPASGGSTLSWHALFLRWQGLPVLLMCVKCGLASQQHAGGLGGGTPLLLLCQDLLRTTAQAVGWLCKSRVQSWTLTR